MDSSSLKDRFNLDYLVTGPNASPPTPAAPSSLPTGVEPFLQSYGVQVVSALQSLPGGKANILNLAEQSGIRLNLMLPVVDYLTSKGVLARTQTDPSGNDTYELVVPRL